MTSFVRSVVVLVVAMWSSWASASDVVVFDRGGGAERTALVRRAAAGPNDTVLTAAESDELDTAYAGGCVDAECYSRAGAAGSVVTVILVQATTITSIDVATATARTRPATNDAIDTVLARLRDPAHFGTLDVSTVPEGSSVLIDGVRYDGGDLPVGPLPVVVRGVDGDRALVVTVVAGVATPVVLPAAASIDVGTIVAVSGAAVAVTGVVVGLLGELWANEALERLQKRERANLAQAEAIEIAGFVGAGVGVVAVAVGLVLRAGSTTVDVDDSAVLKPAPAG